MGKFYEMCSNIMLLCYINLLWIVFTLLGLVVFGVMPATTAACLVIQQLIKGNSTESVSKTFWKSYKSRFILSNKIGIFLILIGYTLFFFLQFFYIFNYAIFILFAALSICYFLMIIYIFPVLVYENNQMDSAYYIKKAFTIPFSNPVPTAMIILWILICYLILYMIPILILFFGVSIVAFIIMFYSHRVYNKRGDVY